ncbi:MAG: hypothetical protein SOW32_13515 [Agathobacter sp.]|nr:hypothetical protein [Agathobacter sp.]
MKIYINEKERYNDVKSTGYSFTIISVIGFILLILMWTNTLPINIDITNKIMTSVVMGILFTIFLIIGIKSFLSLKKIQESADNQEKINSNIITWFFDNIDAAFDTASEENYFETYNTISEILTSQFPTLREEELDYITEAIISKINDEN